MKKKPILTLEEAVENFSTILDLDLYAQAAIGIVEDRKLVITSQEYSKEKILWTAPDYVDLALDILKNSLQVIHAYLQDLVKNPLTDWQGEKTKKGLQELLDLVGESVLHMDKYLDILKIKNKFLVNSLEYKQVKDFYVEYVEPKFSHAPEGREEWEEEWQTNEKRVSLDLEKTGLGDLESLRRDENYELLSLTDDEKKPFVTEELSRNIRLLCDYDEKVLEYEEDPLLLIRQLKDREFQAFSQKLHHEIHAEEEKFYKSKIPVYQYELADKIHKMLMALMLAANPKNLMEVTSRKNCIEYFSDFQVLMRQTYQSESFQSILVYPERAGEKEKIMTNLLLKMAKSFFFRNDAIKEEMIGLIFRLIHMSKKTFPSVQKKEVFLNLLEEDEKIRSVLRNFPNGPLSKNLDVLRVFGKETLFFDPLFQENLPFSLYKEKIASQSFTVLHMPAPVHQLVISKAELVPEFIAFLHQNIVEKKCHFLIQLQDRSSWKESARASLLEKTGVQAKYKDVLYVLSISRTNSFYHQTEEFLSMNDPQAFMEACRKELLENSFFPPHEFKTLESFLKTLPENIYELFFAKKKTLNRKERLDFIELLQHFLILKLLHKIAPESVSFTCKDGLDNGGAFSTSFYAFLSLLRGESWTKEKTDFLLYLFYTRPLKVRERAIDSARLVRALTFLSFFEEALQKENLLKKIEKFLNFSL